MPNFGQFLVPSPKNGSKSNSWSLSLGWWVRNKSCQPDLRFSEQTDVASGTTTLQLGTDVVDLDSGDFPDVTSSDVEDDVNLRGRVLIVLSQRRNVGLLRKT